MMIIYRGNHRRSHHRGKENVIINLRSLQIKKRKRGRPKKSSNDNNDDADNRSVSISSSASTRKRRGTKRQLSANGTSSSVNPLKKRKITSNSFSNKSDYDVISGLESDKNDSVCRICKHPGDLVCCEGCPSVYHADCIRPRIPKKWLDAFEEWHCPSCAPRYHHVPLRRKATKEKWPKNKEPLLKDLKQFLKNHPYLERDYNPTFHASR